MFVTEEIQKERITICEKCEHYTALSICSQCHCFMPVKSRLANKKCPLDKWQKINSDLLAQ